MGVEGQQKYRVVCFSVKKVTLTVTLFHGQVGVIIIFTWKKDINQAPTCANNYKDSGLQSTVISILLYQHRQQDLLQCGMHYLHVK
jgi:hypothetical protein